MSKLYKFMPFRLQFFEDQLLRLTPPNDLNDPFDAKPSIEAIRRKAAFMVDQHGEGAGFLTDADLLHHADTVDYLKSELSKYGIISLTEDPYNLLMWSHYADEHKGIVVGYDELDTMLLVSDDCLSEYDPATSMPLPVKYTRKRPDDKIDDEYIYEIAEKSFFQQIALVKGDDWIYEKEHRILLPLSQADVAILRADVPHSIVESVLNELDVEFTLSAENVYKFERGGINNILNPVLKALVNPIINNLGTVMVFKRPKRTSISSVTFGCKVSDKDINAAIELYKGSAGYNANVRYFKAVLSEQRFDLDFEELFE
ncbi:DUF2971 domain-containing protein [Vibrio cholerae]|uniref:DUF2971 domain-containing protein n=1 Tax=Vibrio diabolicus TaxID=50719 RepID=UPI00287A06B4|nr:DUF2971 domain-containing protein [Vibrio cholerae]EKO3792577.1 DUF2971 domain-containing protein [Vibrio metschnikovii]EGR4264391.1 DUF2971 domain-containing protein [Vibrio cholerae]EGR4276570.1 DUF2971 domain-containing protein [Vibrio cholerae]ELF5301034.1 DUF2971 domain-containing protein [Vibrio cholerae]